jgi:hypothetical protein
MTSQKTERPKLGHRGLRHGNGAKKKRCWEWELMGAAAVILWLVFLTQELSWSSRFTMMFPGVAAEKKVFTPNQPLG